MSEHEFWDLIEQARDATDDTDAQAEQLVEELAGLDSDAIVDFDRQLHDKLGDLFRWDLWAVAHIAHGGSDDESFLSFRAWIVAQGREYFEAAVDQAARALDALEPGDYADAEPLLHAAEEAHRQATGEPLIPDRPDEADEPAGEPWDEEELQELYPRLARRFDF